MKSDQLIEIAKIHIAKSGYEGASLSTIASDVGIKKQSIYSHFKSKEELFLQAFQDAVEKELLFVKRFLEDDEDISLKDLLNQFIKEYLERCQKNTNTSFYIRSSFFPPVQLRELIIKETYKYLDQLEDLIESLFEQKYAVDSKAAAIAFLTLLDGLFVEFLYGTSERLKERTEKSLLVYWQGIRAMKGEF
ncbi:TetR/AcrR family transcriptional regulator [Terribacillus saccharophilus]|uniref:TetR/AcrR family transcriptional regulator n=1 Tax=Terribacillus saccharophilus TaxID=361277 RepID=UPI000C99E24A|nr:TetR/AcrR family transcriptional regulator [Terribacillus goriensis]